MMPGMDGNPRGSAAIPSYARRTLRRVTKDSEGIGIWMCPGNIVSAEVRMDVRVGGSLMVVMRDPDKKYEHRGQFTIIDPPAKLAFTWIAQATDWQPTLVTVEFFAIGATGSELVLTHEKFPRSEVSDRYSGG